MMRNQQNHFNRSDSKDCMDFETDTIIANLSREDIKYI